MGNFLDQFFEHKWVFFYQLILSLLKRYEGEINCEEDFYEFMRQIKVQQLKKSGADSSSSGLELKSTGASSSHQV